MLALILCLAGGCSESGSGTPEDQELTEIGMLREQLKDNVNDPDLRVRLAFAYLKERDGSSAEIHLRRAITLGVHNASIDAALVRSYLQQGKHSYALSEVDKLMQDSADSAMPRLWMLRGEILLEMKSTDINDQRAAFTEAVTRATALDDKDVLEHLNRLSENSPVVAAAREHLDCKSSVLEPIEPVPAVSANGARVIQVGPQRELTRPSQAAGIARDGDTVEIDAGVYTGDVAVWKQNDLILRGVNGRAHLKAAGKAADEKAIWVFAGNDITVENIEFSGAKVRHKNGAGIRLHGRGAVIRNCYFHDNENGILGSNDVQNNDVLIEFSTFERNGYGDGQSHNVYIGRARQLTMQFNYSAQAHVGHLVKSRAQRNIIAFNRLIDTETGDSSYVINLPEGGQTWIVGNELQQGPEAENPHMISFGEEISDKEEQQLIVVNNTFYNRVYDGVFIRNATTADAQVINNIFAGAPAAELLGPGIKQSNLRKPGTWFVDKQNFDYRLVPEAPAIDAATDVSTILDLGPYPTSEYRHPARGQKRLRVGPIDIGAREYCGS